MARRWWVDASMTVEAETFDEAQKRAMELMHGIQEAHADVVKEVGVWAISPVEGGILGNFTDHHPVSTAKREATTPNRNIEVLWVERPSPDVDGFVLVIGNLRIPLSPEEALQLKEELELGIGEP